MWGGPPLPPPGHPLACSGSFWESFWEKKIFDNFFLGGSSLPPPPPRAPPGGLGPQWQLLGKFLRKKKFLTKFFLGGSPPPPPEHPLAACGRNGSFWESFWEKKNFWQNFFGGGSPPSPPPSTSWRPAAAVAASGKVFEKKKFLTKFFLGGVPPPPPPEHLLAACGRSGSFWESFWEKKIFDKNFFWGGSPPPPPQHPLAACGRSGSFIIRLYVIRLFIIRLGDSVSNHLAIMLDRLGFWWNLVGVLLCQYNELTKNFRWLSQFLHVFWPFKGDGVFHVFVTRRRKIAWFTYFDFKYLKNYICQEAKIFRIYSVWLADSENVYISLIGS